jgi:cytoplasmic iron level regulating protein YaaA (DUF328/UPF0246 family)
VIEKNGVVQNGVNERIRKASKFYNLIKNLLWNQDRESVKPKYARCTLRRYCYMEWRHGQSKMQAIEIKFLRAIMVKTK